MAFVALTTAETDAKSPLDDALTTKIKDNLDDLDSRVVVAGAKTFLLELQGALSYVSDWKRSIAAGILNESAQPSRCRFMLKRSGTSGNLEFDLRRHTQPKTPITGIDYQYSAATSSIAQQGAALNTQSIARSAAQISTQSITHVVTAQNIQSIVLLGYVDSLGSDNVQYNLNSAISADTLITDSIVMAGATAGANNGTFVIVAKNRSGGNNVVIQNASGVTQTGAAGTVQEKIMSYNFTNPVPTDFRGPPLSVFHAFAAHTSANNNGNLPIYSLNNGGNNVWVKNSIGATQAGVAGTLNTNFWTYALLSAASVTNYIVGERAKTASHTTPANNVGETEIIAVNSGGNNLILYNPNGVAQAGVAGTINTNRWVYNLPTDPTTQVSVNDTMNLTSHTTPANNGVFTVKEVTVSSVIVVNAAGVVQGGAAGLSSTTRKLVKFLSDQSANYSTLSFIEMFACVDSLYNNFYNLSPFRVLQINRGGGAAFNVVIDAPLALNQVSPAGYVQTEMKSIFTANPTLASDVTGIEPNRNIVGTSTALIAAAIPAQTPIMLYLISVPTGDPRDLTVTLL